MARACGIYSGPLKKAVHSFKYRGRTELARPFSRTLFLFFQSAWAGRPVDLIVPAPLHPKRLRERGFNQSFLLVKDWPLFMGRGEFENPAPAVSAFVLERRKKTSSQTGLDRKERRRNVKNAFFVADAPRIRGKRVLLVDDVYTTGATLDECARALLKEGAAGVDALTLARAMPSV
jgi:ComF family protein